MPTNDSPIGLIEQIIVLQEKTGEDDSNRHHKRSYLLKDIPSLDEDEENTVVPENKPNPTILKIYAETLQKAVESFSQNFDLQMFHLSVADIKMLAYAYKKVIQYYDTEIFFENLMVTSGNSVRPFCEQIDYFKKLEERSIFFRLRGSNTTNRYSITSVIETRGVISEYLLNCLMGNNCRQTLLEVISGDRLNCVNPMETIYNYYLVLNKFFPEMCYIIYDSETNYLGFIVGYYLESLWQQIALLDSQNQLQKLIKEYNCNKLDFFILILIYCFERQQGFDIGEVHLCNWLSGSQTEHDKNKKYLQEGCGLISNGYIKAEGNQRDYNKNLSLSGKLLSDLHRLANGKNSDNLNSILSNNSNLLSIIKPSQGLDSLILAEDEYRVINTIIQRLRDPQQYDLSKWGLMTPSLSGDTEALNSCIVLFYGYTGTGKTHSAGVIANELGRQLVKIEASCLRNCYYGVTEKNVRQLFVSMRQIVTEVTPAPVFLLNEADQLIHKRVTLYNSSTTATENTIQGIFLEELETFPGILIVTTNMADSLDEAMSRRFHFKLELKKPDVCCAKKLWRFHLPSTIPGALEIDCELLAKKYCFTGGKIRIIVQNACFEAMLRGSSSFLTQQDIETYANMENVGQESAQRTIGF